MEHRTTTRALAGLALALTAGVTAQAQDTPRSLKVSGSLTGGRSVTVASDRPAHFAVFAIGRGLEGNPIQVLTDFAPDAVSSLAPGRKLTVRPLSAAQLSRFAPASEVVVVALASETAPRLDAFTVNGRWANDLVLSDSALTNGAQLIASLADAVFGKDVRYTARLMPVELASDMPRGFRMISDACGNMVVSAAPASSPQGIPKGELYMNPDFSNTPPQNYAGRSNSVRQAPESGAWALGALQLPGCTEWVAREMPHPIPRVPVNSVAPVTTPSVPANPTLKPMPVVLPPVIDKN